MLKKKIYRWHRIISIVVALPLFLWAASGLLHPIMANMRPDVASQWIKSQPVNSSRIQTTLQQSLQQNGIDSLTNIRIVSINSAWFYQVQTGVHKTPLYLSTQTGKILVHGDMLYAKYLAQQFLEKNTGTTSIIQATRLTRFDEEYKPGNRFLPVYKVQFKRSDNIRIYVETLQDRFVLAVDNKRALFSRVFTLFHTWGWLSFMGKGRMVVEIVLLLLLLFSLASGLYIFCTTRPKPTKGNPAMKARKNHRITSICFVLFTFMFTFSGLHRLIQKIPNDTRNSYYDQHWFQTSSIPLDLATIEAVVKKKILTISLVHMHGQSYWQVRTPSAKFIDPKSAGHGHEMRDREIFSPVTIYVSVTDNQILPQGEIAYARYLANCFSGYTEKDIQNTETITKFAGEYGFTNKRLPVCKITYGKGGHHERYYVETATGKLAAKISDLDMIESYGFAFLHKHEFLAGFGKKVTDLSTFFWSAAQVIMVIVALLLYISIRKKSLKKTII